MIKAHPQALLFIVLAVVAAIFSTNARAQSVVWNIGNEPLAQFGGPGFPSYGGQISGTFTFAQGGVLIDWNLVTAPFAEIPGLFSSYPGFTFTPGNSQSSNSIFPGRLDLTSSNANGGFGLLVASSIGASFNQPDTLTEVLIIESGPLTTAIGFPITLTGVLLVPEPSLYAMMGSGLGLLALLASRRRRARPRVALLASH